MATLLGPPRRGGPSRSNSSRRGPSNGCSGSSPAPALRGAASPRPPPPERPRPEAPPPPGASGRPAYGPSADGGEASGLEGDSVQAGETVDAPVAHFVAVVGIDGAWITQAHDQPLVRRHADILSHRPRQRRAKEIGQF